MSNSQKQIKWDGKLVSKAIDYLTKDGSMIVSPTKVGYIIMVSDYKGLERKFDAKERNKNKPGVVLCSSMQQLKALALLNPEIEIFYQKHWDNDILLGCILPWKKEALARLPDDGTKNLIMDKRNTSCFVIKFGVPGEQIAKELWEQHGRIAFASSANPSGKGNRGLVEGIGDRISAKADLIIEANDYVKSIQPNKDEKSRYEQGVMISMVNKQGELIPIQNKERLIEPCPILIRKGLDVDKIMIHLSDIFNSWDYRHGDYY